METWRFGTFRLEVENRSLTRDGEPVLLSPQLFDLLVHLLRHRGRLVAKEQLLAEVWQGAHVGEGALTQAIWRLRQILVGSGLDLVTVPRAGYRLVGEAEDATPPAAAPAPETAALAPLGAAGRPRRRGLGGLILAGIVAAVLLAASAAAILPRRIPRTAIPDPPTVLILPFQALAPDPGHAWLSTALGEMLSTELSAGGRVQVVGGERLARERELGGTEQALSERGGTDRPLAKLGGERPLAELARALGAHYVVTGTYLVVRGAAGEPQLRVDVRVLAGRDAGHLASFDSMAPLSGLVGLLETGGRQLRETFRLEPVAEEDAAPWRLLLPLSPAVRELYFEGLARLRDGDALAARRLLDQAIAAAPDDPLLHRTQASVCRFLGDRACTAREAERALAGAIGLPREARLWVEAGALRGRWAEVVPRLEALAALHPRDLDVALELASALGEADRVPEALAVLDRGTQLGGQLEGYGDDPRLDLERAVLHRRAGRSEEHLASALAAREKARARGALGLEFQARAVEAEARWEISSAAELDEVIGWLRERARGPLAENDFAKVLHLEAISLRSRGEFDRAQAAAEEALARWRRLDYRAQIGTVLNTLAAIHYARGNLDAAERTLGRIATEAGFEGDRDLEQRVVDNRSLLALQLGRLPQALELNRRSAAIAGGNAQVAARNRLHRVEILLAMGAIRDAELTLDEVRRSPIPPADGEVQARLDLVAGRFERARGRLGPAREALGHARDGFRGLGWGDDEQAAEIELALLDRDAGAAIETICPRFEQAVKVMAELRRPADQLEAEGHRLRCGIAGGRLVEAAHRLAEGAPRAAASPVHAVRTLWRLAEAELAAAQGRSTEARTAFTDLAAELAASGHRRLALEARRGALELEPDEARRRAELAETKRETEELGLVWN